MADPKFDESLPFEEITFDESQPFEEVDNSISKTESFLRGAAQGASFGLADEIAGAAGALKDVAFTDKTLADLPELYTEERDESRQAFKASEEANPKTAFLGNVAGGLASTLATGGATALAKGGALGAKGIAALGAAEGAAAGFGYSEGDTAGEIVRDTATGAVLGGVLPGAVGKVGTGNVVAGGLGAYGGSQLINEDDSLLEKAAKIGGGATAGILAKYGLQGASNAISRSNIGTRAGKQFDLGQQGGNILDPEQQVQVQKEAYKKLDDLGNAIVEGKKVTEEGIEAAKKQAELRVQEQVAKHNENIDLARKELEDLLQKSRQQTRQVLEQGKEAGIKQANEKLEKEAVNLAQKINKTRDGLTKEYGRITKNSNVKLDFSDEIDQLRTSLGNYKVNLRPDQAAQLDAISGNLDSWFAKKLDPEQFKGLKQFIYQTAKNLPNEQRRLFLEVYTSIDNKIGENIPELKGINNSFKNLFLLEDTLGNYSQKASDKLFPIDIVEFGDKVAGQRELGRTFIEAPITQAAKVLDQELADSLEKGVLSSAEKARIAKQLNITEKQVNERANELLKTQRPDLFEIINKSKIDDSEAKKLLKQEIDISTPKDLLQQQKRFQSLEKLLGRQDLLEEELQVITPQKTISTLEVPFKPNVKSGKDFESAQNIAKKAFGEERGEELIGGASKALEKADLYNIDLSNIAATQDAPAQILKQTPAILDVVPNQLGRATGAVKRSAQNLSNFLSKSTPKELQNLSKEVISKVKDTESAKKLTNLFNVASTTTDPIKRNATLFLIQQDPGFRELMKDKKE
jgi:hypothetical protein